MIIKIEDYYGNDLCSFFAEVRPFDFKRFVNCNISDRHIDEDGNEYIRIQIDTRIKAGNYE
jgi:hypothetical protein